MKENIVSLTGWTEWQGRAVLTSKRTIQHLPRGRQAVAVLGMLPGSDRRFFCVRIEEHGETICAVAPIATAEIVETHESAVRDWAELQILRFQASNQPEAALAVAA